MSGAPRRQCVRDAFRNYKAQLDLELFFSSGCTAGDEGGREGECATGEEVQKVARQDRRQPTSPLPDQREQHGPSAPMSTDSGQGGLPGSPA